MTLLEDLKQRFHVRDVAPYGTCIVIPEMKFEPHWEDDLKTQGIKVFYTALNGHPTALVRLKEGTSRIEPGEKLVYSPPSPTPTLTAPSKPAPLPMHNPERFWSPEEDNKLIELWNQKPEIPIEDITKTFPNRGPSSVKNRLQRLRNAGKIEARYGGPKRHKKKVGRPKKVTVESHAGPSKPIESHPTPATTTSPFEIKTTLSLNITVDCSDRNAVANFLQVIKELRNLEVAE